jgi:molecular chaperone GrpE
MSDTSRDVQDNANPADSGMQDKLPEASADAANNGTKPPESLTTDEPKAGEASLDAQLTEAKAKAEEYLDGWQRARAEFANYRKRADKERDEAYQTGAVETLSKLVPIIDDFDRAIANVPADKANDDIIKGFTLIHRKLVTLLENTGIKVINPVGEEFNPAYHEAIGKDESSNVPSGHISIVLQKGYLYGDKVLRPALVRVVA